MKTYKLRICERRTYNHTAVIQIPDDADINCICYHIEEAAVTVDDLECVSGVYCVKEIIGDGSPDCECEVEGYDEVTETTEDTE